MDDRYPKMVLPDEDGEDAARGLSVVILGTVAFWSAIGTAALLWWLA